MAILFQSSNHSMLSLKIFLISTTVLSAAIILKLSAPVVTDFAVTEVPSIWNGVVSWLKPPYLYLVINCIIITIVASSKLQNKLDDRSSPAVASPENLVQFHPIKDVRPATSDYYPPVLNELNGVVLKNEAVEATPMVYEYPPVGDYVAKVEKVPEINPFVSEKDVSFGVKPFSYPEPNEVFVVDRDEVVISKSSQTTISSDYSVSELSAEKPPASARFSHRRNLKSTPEGGKALRVSKPRKQDTLESTWKTITEGRAMPLTRHLKKSDTWETHGHAGILTPPPQKMKKSETFNERSNVNSPLTPSPGSGKLKKEPSLSQDDLNRRVEAFIKKFNEDMRMQRQESLQQYHEMINRGSH